MKRVVLCHRWGGAPESVWYPWVKLELELRGFTVDVPALPDPDKPRLEAWLPVFSDAVGNADEHTVLIGHSLGCATILRYLEQLEEGTRVGGAVLVAGFTDAMGNEEIADFFQRPLDFSLCRRRSRGFVAIHSNNDPACAPDYLKHALKFLDALEARLLIIPGGGHFSENERCEALPEVIQAVALLSARPA